MNRVLYVFGEIGWEVDAWDVRHALREVQPGDDLQVFIHSPGGDILEGMAIYSLIKMCPARTKTAKIIGLCASMTTVVSQACSRIELSEMSAYMLHAPSGYARGGSAAFRQMAKTLDGLEDTVLEAYAKRTRQPKAKLKADFMNGQDHYLTPTEAIREGFADAIFELPTAVASPEALPGLGQVERAMLAATAQADWLAEAKAQREAAQAAPGRSEWPKQFSLLTNYQKTIKKMELKEETLNALLGVLPDASTRVVAKALVEAGNDEALAVYLASVRPVAPVPAPAVETGQAVERGQALSLQREPALKNVVVADLIAALGGQTPAPAEDRSKWDYATWEAKAPGDLMRLQVSDPAKFAALVENYGGQKMKV